MAKELDLGVAWAEAEAAIPEGFRIMLWQTLGRDMALKQQYVAKLKHPWAFPMGYHYAATPAEAIRKMVAAEEWKR